MDDVAGSAYLRTRCRSLTEVAAEMRAFRDLSLIRGEAEIAETVQGMIDTLEDEMERREGRIC